MTAVQHHGRYRIDAVLPVKLLKLPHFVGKRARRQHLPSTGLVQPGFTCQPHQRLLITRVLAFAEVSAKQDLLQRHLTPFLQCPKQQTVSVEGVVEVGALLQVELEADGIAAFDLHRFAISDVLSGTSVFAHQVLDGFLAFGRHVRVQLERLVGQLNRNLTRHVLDRPFQRRRSQCAPRAHHIGDEIDGHRRRHDCPSSASCLRYWVVVMPA
ncbi:hypothetical protein D3C72_538450 [compost metagenome]